MMSAQEIEEREERKSKYGGGDALSGHRDPETGKLIFYDKPIYLCDPDYEAKVAEARRKASLPQ